MTVPRWIVPLLVVLAAVAGLAGARVISIPSVEIGFERPSLNGPSRTTTLLVDGVRCVDTALQASKTLEDLAGVERFVAYASRNRVEITYHPEMTDVGAIVEAIEGPVFDEESMEITFGLFTVLEVDGGPPTNF